MGDAPPALPRGPLVGRAEHLERFAALLDGDDRGVVLHGAAGVGKTRLAEELVDMAADRGWTTRFLRCRPAALDLPLATFAPVLSVPQVQQHGIPLLVAAREQVETLGADAPLLLGVDDVHLIDPASALLLHQLVTDDIARVVLTYRSHEYVPDGVSQLWHEGLVVPWEVDRLDEATTEQLAEALAGRALEPDAGPLLWRLTEGNPLFVHALVREAGVSSLSRDAVTGAVRGSATLNDFVQSRLAELDGPARAALEVVALGEPLDLELVEQLTPTTVLADLESRGFLEVSHEDGGPEVSLAHPLYGEVLRSATSWLRARGVFRSLAEAASDRAHRPIDPVRLAQWTLDGGLQAPPELLRTAARRALDAHEHVLSDRLARAAHEREPTVDSGLLLAEVLYQADAATEAEDLLAALVDDATDDRERTAIAAARAGSTCFKGGGPAVALEVLALAEPTVTDPAAHAELVAWRANCHSQLGHADRVHELTGPLLEGPPGRAQALAVIAELTTLSRVGDAPGAIALAERFGVALGDTQTRTQVSARSLRTGSALALVQLGSIDQAVAVAEAVARDADAEGAELDRSLSDLAVGWARLWAGRPKGARRAFERGAATVRRTGHGAFERWLLGGAALAAAVDGDPHGARQALERRDSVGPKDLIAYDAWADLARAELHLASHELGDARAVLRAGAERCREQGTVFEEAALLHRTLAIGAPEVDVVDRLRALASDHPGLIELLADHAEAQRAGDADGLAEVAERIREAGARALAVRVAAETSEAFARSKDQRAATRWASLARSWADEGEEGVAVPLGATTLIDPLTRREREVANLAAAGLTSAEIAERLFLSLRTVENHLARCFTKLGIRSRRELADALRA